MKLKLLPPPAEQVVYFFAIQKNTGSGLFGSIRYLFISQLKPHQDYFTVIFRALYTPFWAYTHIVQVPLPVALIRPSGVTVATFVLLLS